MVFRALSPQLTPSSLMATKPFLRPLIRSTLLVDRLLFIAAGFLSTLLLLAATYPYLTSNSSNYSTINPIPNPNLNITHISISTNHILNPNPNPNSNITTNATLTNTNPNPKINIKRKANSIFNKPTNDTTPKRPPRRRNRRRGRKTFPGKSKYYAPPTPPSPPPPPPLPPTFYDDPAFSYTIDREITHWDEKRDAWLKQHQAFAATGKIHILMVTGSQPGPCESAIGDHLLLRLYKNKADYCRVHGIDLFYNTAILPPPSMSGPWAKLPLIRSAMVAHPEAEWIWWVDADAAFTDIDFFPPMYKYTAYNFIVPGWADMVYKDHSWVGLNAGVFLIRNCQWSLDLLREWAKLGPQTPEYSRWGKLLDKEIHGKITVGSDDQAALVYTLISGRRKWGDKVYFESEYDLHGYWEGIVERLERISEEYMEMEKREKRLRRRRAERDTGRYAEKWVWWEKRRPLVTHFAGCQVCGDGSNPSWSRCLVEIRRALNFADTQVLRAYGFARAGLTDLDPVVSLPFDFPAANS